MNILNSLIIALNNCMNVYWLPNNYKCWTNPTSMWRKPKVFQTTAISEWQRHPWEFSSSTHVDVLNKFVTYSWTRMDTAAVLEYMTAFPCKFFIYILVQVKHRTAKTRRGKRTPLCQLTLTTAVCRIKLCFPGFVTQ